MIIKNGKRLDGFCVDSLPIGTLQPYLGLKAPNGYLICDGSLISKTVYPDLYAICGSLFGTETSTHFYLPDLRGKTIAGYNADDDTLNTIGKLLGAISHTHTSAAHTHSIAGHTHTSAAHSHTSAAHSHSTGNHTLTVAEMPSHRHDWSKLFNADSSGGSWVGDSQFSVAAKRNIATTGFPDVVTSNQLEYHMNSVGGGGAHNHGNTGSTTPGNTGSTTPGATGSTSLTTNSTTPGATGSASNYQPTFVANWIVKAKMIVPVTAYVENTLDSVSESNALSAAQGKVLNDKINSLSTVASTGSYNDLINKPERVDYTSQITCDYGTLNSNFNYCFLKDDVVYLNLTYTLNTALTAGTQYNFCKIPAAIRPKGNVIMYAFSHQTSHMITNYVRSTGELVIAPEKAVPAGKEINMWTVYYIK